jgi:putative membrane protein insertion efficiency factor
MLSSLAIKIISAYQGIKQKLGLSSPCRYSPTCGQYSKEAINKYGILKGVLLGAGRILRCNPLFKGGHDPVI